MTKVVASPMPKALSTLFETPITGQRPRNLISTTLLTSAVDRSSSRNSLMAVGLGLFRCLHCTSRANRFQQASPPRQAHADAECYGHAQKWCEFEKTKCRKRDRNFVAFAPKPGRPAFAASRPDLRHGFC